MGVLFRFRGKRKVVAKNGNPEGPGGWCRSGNLLMDLETGHGFYRRPTQRGLFRTTNGCPRYVPGPRNRCGESGQRVIRVSGTEGISGSKYIYRMAVSF